jgi:periplasmic divalent cation tolerance protein
MARFFAYVDSVTPSKPMLADTIRSQLHRSGGVDSAERPIQTAPDPICVVILSTAPDVLLAKRIAHVLVEEKLAACVQLTPPSLSVYEWDGEIQGSEEIGLIIKTSRSVARSAIDRLVQMHPYEVPEVIVLPIVGGHSEYLNWISQQTQP